jgi:hypothetical protein
MQGLWTGAVDPVHRSTVDRRRGMPPLLIWTAQVRSNGWRGFRVASGGGQREAAGCGGARWRLAGRSPASGQFGFPGTKLNGRWTKSKRRTKGTHRRPRKGGRGAVGGDRAARRSSGGALRRRRCRGVEERKGGVREMHGVVLPLYRAEREGERARRRWSGSSPAGH